MFLYRPELWNHDVLVKTAAAMNLEATPTHLEYLKEIFWKQSGLQQGVLLVRESWIKKRKTSISYHLSEWTESDKLQIRNTVMKINTHFFFFPPDCQAFNITRNKQTALEHRKSTFIKIWCFLSNSAGNKMAKDSISPKKVNWFQNDLITGEQNQAQTTMQNTHRVSICFNYRNLKLTFHSPEHSLTRTLATVVH